MKNKKSMVAVAAVVVVALVAGLAYQQFGGKAAKYPSRDINMVEHWAMLWVRAWEQISWLPTPRDPADP